MRLRAHKHLELANTPPRINEHYGILHQQGALPAAARYYRAQTKMPYSDISRKLNRFNQIVHPVGCSNEQLDNRGRLLWGRNEQQRARNYMLGAIIRE
jgi:hypothetical protein